MHKRKWAPDGGGGAAFAKALKTGVGDEASQRMGEDDTKRLPDEAKIGGDDAKRRVDEAKRRVEEAKKIGQAKSLDWAWLARRPTVAQLDQVFREFHLETRGRYPDHAGMTVDRTLERMKAIADTDETVASFFKDKITALRKSLREKTVASLKARPVRQPTFTSHSYI